MTPKKRAAQFINLVTEEIIEKAVEKAVAAEREACLACCKKIFQWSSEMNSPLAMGAAFAVELEIRERNKPRPQQTGD